MNAVRAAILSALLLFGATVAEARGAPPVKIALETTAGTITIELNRARAPITAGNFLRYVDEKRFDGTTFYRAAKSRSAEPRGFIQGGVRHFVRRVLAPIAHEPTSQTGLRHVDGTISMARGLPGTAMGDFFIAVGPLPSMDADPNGRGDGLGFAAFGKVVGGMGVVRRILDAPTLIKAGSGGMRGQMLQAPVRIMRARRA